MRGRLDSGRLLFIVNLHIHHYLFAHYVGLHQDYGLYSNAGIILPRHSPNPNLTPVLGLPHHPSITTSSPSCKNVTPSFFSSDSSFFGSVRSIKHAMPVFSPCSLALYLILVYNQNS